MRVYLELTLPKVKTLLLRETIKEKSTFRAKALNRELVVGGRGKPRVFL